MRAPPAAAKEPRNARRLIFTNASPAQPDGRLTHPEIRGTAADVARHSVIDLSVGGTMICCEKGGGGHDLARLAIAALGNLFIYPCLLDRMEFVSETFDGHNLVPNSALNRRLAGARGLAIYMYRTRTAHGDAAAVFGSGQLQQVAEDPEQGHVGFRSHDVRTTVDFQGELRHWATSHPSIGGCGM